VVQVDHDMLIRIVKSKQEILKCLEKKLQKYLINCFRLDRFKQNVSSTVSERKK